MIYYIYLFDFGDSDSTPNEDHINSEASNMKQHAITAGPFKEGLGSSLDQLSFWWLKAAVYVSPNLVVHLRLLHHRTAFDHQGLGVGLAAFGDHRETAGLQATDRLQATFSTGAVWKPPRRKWKSFGKMDGMMGWFYVFALQVRTSLFIFFVFRQILKFLLKTKHMSSGQNYLFMFMPSTTTVRISSFLDFESTHHEQSPIGNQVFFPECVAKGSRFTLWGSGG